jgi:hypothetical protein
MTTDRSREHGPWSRAETEGAERAAEIRMEDEFMQSLEDNFPWRIHALGLETEVERLRAALTTIAGLPEAYEAPPTANPIGDAAWARVGGEAYRIAASTLARDADLNRWHESGCFRCGAGRPEETA